MDLAICNRWKILVSNDIKFGKCFCAGLWLVCSQICFLIFFSSVFICESLTPWKEKAMAPHSITLAWKIHGRRSLVGCSPWGLQESDTTEQLHVHFSLSCIGEGNGNPLQYSCLENPRDGGPWWAAVYGVAQSRTWLKRLSSSSSNPLKAAGPRRPCLLVARWIWCLGDPGRTFGERESMMFPSLCQRSITDSGFCRLQPQPGDP